MGGEKSVLSVYTPNRYRGYCVEYYIYYGQHSMRYSISITTYNTWSKTNTLTRTYSPRGVKHYYIYWEVHTYV